MKQIEICIDCYTFFVDVSHYFVQKPLGKWCDNDQDCSGYTDLELEITSIEEDFEDGSYLVYSDIHLKELFDLLVDKYYEDVYDRVLDKLEEDRLKGYEALQEYYSNW